MNKFKIMQILMPNFQKRIKKELMILKNKSMKLMILCKIQLIWFKNKQELLKILFKIQKKQKKKPQKQTI